MSKIFDERYINSLCELGLTQKEALVYGALLSFVDAVGTSRIIRATGLHGQYVYNALKSLEKNGLVSHQTFGHRKRYMAAHPSRFEFLAEQKRIIASTVAHDLASHFQRNHAQDFFLYQGDDEFIAHELSEVRTAKYGDEWLIVGGSGDKFVEIMDYTLADYDAIRTKKNIHIRYIGSQDQYNPLVRGMPSRSMFSVRVLEGFSKSIVNTLVRQDKVSFTTYGPQVLTYEVYNTTVAASYKNFFEALWDKCN